MINYLPPDQKKQLRAARTNVLLFRYNIGLIFVASFLTLATLTVFLLLSSEKKAAEDMITANQSRASNFSSVQARADSFRKDLSDAKAIFDNEILYSKIYLEIAGILPAGTALEALDLNESQLGTPLSLSFKIKGEQQAASLLSAFKHSTMFGGAASYGTLKANTGTDSASYPYIISINVTIDKGAVR